MNSRRWRYKGKSRITVEFLALEPLSFVSLNDPRKRLRAVLEIS